ncbi:MAG TPA: dihydroxyacetone kinase subunit DhaL [Candidatus Atribacteria bacterium]|nr:dihydroxyacetone kinase subunit DhaL [Candidatus Atribacteria bacterium]HPZ81593.1 dihydroxyacetone kinase subunit DhaL [Candidatus Atribacteria bacterium]HQE25429.1 dihydroxyacetone kinase subunit DhaL [Candidatus Atribacteria bacterium]
MSCVIPFEKIKMAFSRIEESLEKHRQYLNDLDSPIGDSDHGESVCSAFRKVKEVVDKFPEEKRDIGELLQTVGKSIVLSGGAAMGPLYGTAFMDAGKAVAGKEELSPSDLVKMWEAFAGGIKRRGQVELGDKTMYDAIYPSFLALQKAYEEGKSLKEMLEEAIEGARRGMESTKDLVSKRGRSSRLGERSRGHIDPGAASSYFIIEAFLGSLE